MIKVKFFTLLRLYIGKEEIDIETEQIDMKSLPLQIKDILDNYIIREKLLNDDGTLRQGTIILLNGHNIIHIDKLETIVQSGDVVSLFPPGGGG